jgi:hypothetical protein
MLYQWPHTSGLPSSPRCLSFEGLAAQCTNPLTVRVPLSPGRVSSHSFSDGYAERCEAVQVGHSDSELGTT